MFASCFIHATDSSASETIIHSFTNFPDGAQPNSKLIVDKAGNLFGTAVWGGLPYGCGGEGCGVVFELMPPSEGRPGWTETVIHQFPGGAGGELPGGALAEDDQGNLYGGTFWGGTGVDCPSGITTGCGTIFKLSPPSPGQSLWTETTLWSLQGGRRGPWGITYLAVGRHGELYGTTSEGGVGCSTVGCGTVIELLPPEHGKTDWREKVLYRFQGHSDGSWPAAAVILDKRGNLYGTTTGTATTGSGGTVFELSPPAAGQENWTETVLKRFRAIPTSPNSGPAAPLIMDKQGNLYGTTVSGGIGCGGGGCGLVFELQPPSKGHPAWRESTIYAFKNHHQRGALFPAGGVISGKNGELYTTTLRGGGVNVLCRDGRCSAIVMLTPPAAGQSVWTQKIIHKFGGPPDGGTTSVGLTLDEGGRLFGTLVPGGSDWEWGAVFEIKNP
jgi:uncharacterized protein YceK